MKRSTQHASCSVPDWTTHVLLVRVNWSLLCIVADSTQERQQTLHYHFHTIPTGFLACHLSYYHRACHYRVLRGLDGVWSSR